MSQDTHKTFCELFDMLRSWQDIAKTTIMEIITFIEREGHYKLTEEWIDDGFYDAFNDCLERYCDLDCWKLSMDMTGIQAMDMMRCIQSGNLFHYGSTIHWNTLKHPDDLFRHFIYIYLQENMTEFKAHMLAIEKTREEAQEEEEEEEVDESVM